jgi:nicotinamidase-related amidase
VKALLIADMLDDFVTGALANPNAPGIVEPLVRLLDYARGHEEWVIVFSNDAHDPSDPELRIWGEHAMAGSPGARVIPELEPRPDAGEIVSPKRAYGALEGTGLDEQLRAIGVEEVVICGQHAHLRAPQRLWRADPRLSGDDPPRCRVCVRGSTRKRHSTIW